MKAVLSYEAGCCWVGWRGVKQGQANSKQENRQGKNDQPSSTVLGVYSTCEKAEQAYKETTFAESREFVDFYGESYMEKIDAGILITNP